MDYSFDYSSAMTSMSPGAIAATVICSLIVVVISIVAMAKIFKKAGKPGWHAIIPILNLFDLFEIAWGKGVMFLLLLIPIVNFVIMIMLYVKLAHAFGKSTGFAVGLIFLGFIFMLILAFGDAKYIGPDGVPAAAPYAPPPSNV